MMTLKGGLSSKMQLMENLSLLSAAFENVVRAVESLEAHYETVGDSSRLNAVALELEGMEEGFSEIERIVVSVSRTVPAGQSAIKEQCERLEKEIRMRKQETTKVLHDLEKTYAGCQKQLEQKLTPKKSQQKEQSQGGESATVQNMIVNTSVKRSEEQEQYGNLRIQSATSFQPCSSSTTFNSSGAAAFYPSSSFVYSSTPVTSQFSMSYKPSVWD